MRNFADMVKNVIGDEKVIYVYYEKGESGVKVVTNWENFLEVASKIDYDEHLDMYPVKSGTRFVIEDNSYWEFIQDDVGYYFNHVNPVNYATLPVSKITKVEDLFY